MTTVMVVYPGCSPLAIAVNPVTGIVYADLGAPCYTVNVIDGATSTVTATIPQVDAENAESIAVDTQTNTFFVADYGDFVAAYSGTTNTVIGTVDPGGQPDSVAVTPSPAPSSPTTCSPPPSI